MLETSKERVELLKAGYDLKLIEKIYMENHNLKLILGPIYFEMVELTLENETNLNKEIRTL